MSLVEQFIILPFYYAGGLFFWPIWRILFRKSNYRLDRKLLMIFLINLVTEPVIAAFIWFVLPNLGRLDSSWMLVFLLFPLTNFVSLGASVFLVLRARRVSPRNLDRAR